MAACYNQKNKLLVTAIWSGIGLCNRLEQCKCFYPIALMLNAPEMCKLVRQNKHAVWHNSGKWWDSRPVFITGTNCSKIHSKGSLRLNRNGILMWKFCTYRLKNNNNHIYTYIYSYIYYLHSHRTTTQVVTKQNKRESYNIVLMFSTIPSCTANYWSTVSFQ